MKRIIINAFLICLLYLSLLFPTTVFATSSLLSDDSTGIAITVVVPRPEAIQPMPMPEFDPIPHPEIVEIHHIYPVHVWESREDGRREIIRVYELGYDESSTQIPRQPFERDGFRFELAEIVRREMPTHSLREHTEIVSINTQTNDLATVIRLLSPTLEYLADDGYFGILTLDVTSIQIESQGTTSSSFTATRTREFPHLSSADTSLVPRTLTYGGRTYNLSDVEWRTQSSTAIDYRQVASTFTAVATYSRVGTRTTGIGYTTTAEYTGQLSRIGVGRTEFTAHFIGIPIATPVLVDTPSSETVPDSTTEPNINTNVEYVHIGGIVIEVEKENIPAQDTNDIDTAYTNDNLDNVVSVAEYESNSVFGLSFRYIIITLMFIGGIIMAFFVGRKGLLSGRSVSCFLLAILIVGGLLVGTSQTIYATNIPRYSFGRQDTHNTQDSMHFNDSQENETSSQQNQNSDAVIHFNPEVVASDGVAGHLQIRSTEGYNYGETIGVLTIERLNRQVNVIAGATMSAMDFGAGWFSFSGLNTGNTALIGHNRGTRNGFFSFVRHLQEGDIITLEAGGITRSYAVTIIYYIEETDFTPLLQFGDDRLTLITCREYFRTQRRIAIAIPIEIFLRNR